MSEHRPDWHSPVYHPGEDSFYDSPEWRKLRRACLYRDRYICQRCNRRFKAEDLSAHHLTPRLEGGPDDLTNLITLCVPCHDFVEVADLRTAAAIAGSLSD